MSGYCDVCGCDYDQSSDVCPWCGNGCIVGPMDAFVAFIDQASEEYHKRQRRRLIHLVIAAVLTLCLLAFGTM